MLFSTIVCMSSALLCQWIIVVVVLVLKLDVASNSQILNDYTDRFDGDFDNFLREMGTLVYKSPKADVGRNEVRHAPSTPSLPIKYWKTKNTPKGILEDVLMMKLVSYYEDKYKLSPLEPTTTESITFNFNGLTNTKANAVSKKNLYKYNIIDNEEVLNSFRKPTKPVRYAKRKKQRDIKRMHEMREPEVVVL